MSNVLEMAKKLYTMGKKGYAVNYQDNEHMKKCGRLMIAQQDRINALMAENADLREEIAHLAEEIAIMREDDPEDRHDGFPEDDPGEPLEAAAPGEAAEDFWEDMWP